MNTTTTIFASESDEPLLNSSKTNLPIPSEEERSSAAMSTIQPTPSEILRPAKMRGRDDGMMILNSLAKNPSFSTRATFMWSLSILATPSAVLAIVAQSEQSATVIADAMKAGLILYTPINGKSAKNSMNGCLSGLGNAPITTIRTIDLIPNRFSSSVFRLLLTSNDTFVLYDWLCFLHCVSTC